MVSVRSAVPRDAAEVADVHVRSWQAGYRGLLPDVYLDGLRPQDRMRRYTFGSSDPTQPHTVVAIQSGTIRGFVTTGPTADLDAPDAGEILALYVEPLSWGVGIGRILMKEARARLDSEAYTNALLWVLEGNDRAQRFYRSDGWSPDGNTRVAEVWGARVSEARYRRHLP